MKHISAILPNVLAKLKADADKFDPPDFTLQPHEVEPFHPNTGVTMTDRPKCRIAYLYNGKVCYPEKMVMVKNKYYWLFPTGHVPIGKLTRSPEHDLVLKAKADKMATALSDLLQGLKPLPKDYSISRAASSAQSALREYEAGK